MMALLQSSIHCNIYLHASHPESNTCWAKGHHHGDWSILQRHISMLWWWCPKVVDGMLSQILYCHCWLYPLQKYVIDFPVLACIVHDILAIPGVSISVELLFSSRKHTLLEITLMMLALYHTVVNMINYEYEWHTIHDNYVTNTYDRWVAWYNTITLHYNQNCIVIILGQP